jgi:glycine/D-amino acid oxidase-like deaminating enzyme
MNPELHGRIGSCWTATAPKTAYPKLDASANADVAIIGAGIVGLSTAILLAKAGLSVVVLEALTVGGQVTGRSTAKITTQHGLIYDHLIRTLGIESARRYAEANRAAVEQMKTWISEFEISCAYETKDAYVYCCDPTHIDALEAEAAASRRVGLDAELLAEAPLPFATTGALRCKDQAQFNPAQYLVGLARAAEAAGARIFEHSRVTSIEDNDGWRIKAGKATLNVSQAVQATNLPSWGAIPFDEYTRPRCHTAMAFRTRDTTVEGMFIGIDDHHSLRTGRDGEGDLLVVLGPKFDTGQEGQVSAYFLELEAWSRRNLNVDAAAWRWVNEDYDTADRIPYAGELKSAPGLYVATGFNAWGISNGTAAGNRQTTSRRDCRLGGALRPDAEGAGEFQQGWRYAVARPQRGRYRAGRRQGHLAGARKDRRAQEHERRAACRIGLVYSQGMHGDVERRRPYVGLPLSWLDVRCRWKRAARSCSRAAGAKAAAADLAGEGRTRQAALIGAPNDRLERPIATPKCCGADVAASAAN